ncbi:SMP-30/gluconolactonase/LRE family protein [Flagellimonas sp. 389]|uniref:SMP-30/gluconolactonase/LRE family protein n=1 Tax=Flagellimonas sp. 389 TaxID=2835862 RepID=UPI001BD1FC75|nr:SMP-30/gluconolactonase/LRE family protein [Flagellimonas sp. 389]MBS9463038.1 SMP-30/gluconolactonase/LRE family protein [Flagellimonas sp. 389]
MKTCNFLLKSGLALACLALFTFTSCIDDFDGGGPKPKKVKTLFGADFPANDGLHVNDNGTVFASNFGKFDTVIQKYSGTKVFKIKRNGSISVKASGFEAPMGGVQDSKGNFYFNNENNNDAISGVLVKVAPDGTSSEVGEIAGWPSGLAIDENDIIYVANFFASTMHKVAPDGTISLLATDDRLFGCVGIDIDKDGNIITANFFNADILKVTPQGEVSVITRIPDTTTNFAIGYMTILDDYIYASGISENVIYKVSFDGTSEIFAGTGENATTDGLLDEATFSQPNGIAADKKRKILYISQFGEPGLRMIQL